MRFPVPVVMVWIDATRRARTDAEYAAKILFLGSRGNVNDPNGDFAEFLDTVGGLSRLAKPKARGGSHGGFDLTCCRTLRRIAVSPGCRFWPLR
jgi:hypothetical protein